MKLDNEFAVGVPVEQAWAVLTDLELIAPCMPGAQLTGVTDGVYTGKVKIKVGPVTAEYTGTAQFSEKDDASHRAVIDARGRDTRGQGNATAIISAQLQASGTGTVVTVSTDLSIAGRIAQFGSGMIKEISAKLLGQFVECLEERLGAGSLERPADGEPARAPAASDVAASHGATSGESAVGAPASSVAPAMPPAQAAPAQAAPAQPAALNLMSVAGPAIYKRVVPLVVALIAVVIIIIILVVR